METQKKAQLEQIYKQNAENVYRYARFMLSDKEKAEDVTSEAFKKLAENEDLSKIENPKAWLITVARNSMVNDYKKFSKVDAMEDETENIQDMSDPDIQDVAVKEDLVNKIKGQLETLDDVSKEVVTLKTWEGYQFNEIAKMTGMKESAVKLRYYRALEKIKASLATEIEHYQPNLSYMAAMPLIVKGVSLASVSSEFAVPAGVAKAVLGTAANVGLLSTTLGKVVAGILGFVIFGGVVTSAYVVGKNLAPDLLPIKDDEINNPPVVVVDDKPECENPIVIDKEKGYFICKGEAFKPQSLANYTKCQTEFEKDPNHADFNTDYRQSRGVEHSGVEYTIYSKNKAPYRLSTLSITEDCVLHRIQVMDFMKVVTEHSSKEDEFLGKGIFAYTDIYTEFVAPELDVKGYLYRIDKNASVEMPYVGDIIHMQSNYVVIMHQAVADSQHVSLYDLDRNSFVLSYVGIPLRYESGRLEQQIGDFTIAKITEDYLEINYKVEVSYPDSTAKAVTENRTAKFYFSTDSKSTSKYTDSRFVNFSFEYPNSWQLVAYTTGDFNKDAGNGSYRVELVKKDYHLIYIMDFPYMYDGGPPSCFKWNEIEYEALSGNWARSSIKYKFAANDYDWSYENGTLMDRTHNSEEFESYFEGILSDESGPLKIEDYEACIKDGPPFVIDTTLTGKDHEGKVVDLPGLISIKANILGEEDSNVLEEMDSIVMTSKGKLE